MLDDEFREDVIALKLNHWAEIEFITYRDAPAAFFPVATVIEDDAAIGEAFRVAAELSREVQLTGKARF